jgi:hypothetical protein
MNKAGLLLSLLAVMGEHELRHNALGPAPTSFDHTPKKFNNPGARKKRYRRSKRKAEHKLEEMRHEIKKEFNTRGLKPFKIPEIKKEENCSTK